MICYVNFYLFLTACYLKRFQNTSQVIKIPKLLQNIKCVEFLLVQWQVVLLLFGTGVLLENLYFLLDSLQ